jgi:large subunit ribosomal protein L18
MEVPAVDRRNARLRRHKRVRRKVVGTLDRPRLSVYRSLNHIYAQIVNDTAGQTLVSASTLEAELSETLVATRGVPAAKEVGRALAERAREKGVRRVVFDRGGNLYHGRVAALAEEAREGGLDF